MLEPYYQDLARNPEDWALRSVFADWCEDNNQPDVAARLRWMVENHKRPHCGSDQSFTWFNGDAIQTKENLGDPESDIPERVYKLLPGGLEAARHKTYLSLREAEEAFQAAWAQARKRWRGQLSKKKR